MDSNEPNLRQPKCEEQTPTFEFWQFWRQKFSMLTLDQAIAMHMQLYPGKTHKLLSAMLSSLYDVPTDKEL